MKLNPFAIALTVSLLTGCGLYESRSTSEVVDPGPGRPVVAEQTVMLDLSAQQKHKPVGLMKREADWSGQAVAPSQVAAVSSGIRLPSERLDRESYAHIEDNAVKRVQEVPVSTFSIDVDTGSYANLRRILKEGRLPPKDAVRVEEMINYFTYDDTVPKEKNQSFSITTELGPNPWNQETRLLRVGLRSWVPQDVERPSANLVFLVDVSGSMRSPDKLPLLKRSLRLLTGQLDADDRVTLVVYAGASGVVLEPTAGNRRATIEQALERLHAGGSTNGASGIRLAYGKAREAFIETGVNRVILATDGDFNVGTVNHQALIDLIEENRKDRIALTTLGFGGGNYNDQLMEQLADHGNGNYAYIDTLLEARKVLVEEMGATLQTVAGDVKIQIEFNPDLVAEYRLIGYENRLLAREDFNNDKVDAGEIGAGHSVSALYEIALVGGKGNRIDPLRYGSGETKGNADGDEIAFLRLRYKRPGSDISELIERPLLSSEIKQRLDQTSHDYRFTSAVAAFGQALRGGSYLQNFGYDEIIKLARGARGEDSGGYRNDLIRLVGLADDLSVSQTLAISQKQ
ncbi:MAG: hypothetical protein OI74_06690 [Gammaproteobacteria bacterium (ex Lamellibrachia satsuma)]|nr:MAG: VWA domain-containing protein [Gammaproteobacteria bacterium (ex Lamellibrachia satsuma)]RRS33747.1 MAG: hypothetical protein OI74_06690 [Gammaproteobacteria bacterium (ex Lamellibrachia satsuma)]RRS37541.1 MAG: hypothetical protein NV67_00320 [Gammaproteobacteria bacterium (ex Lamellibrachia satsuma)]